MCVNSEKAVRGLFAVALCAAMSLCAPVARADWKVDTGYSRLLEELGAGIPTGAGVEVAQIEAKDANGYYMPDKNHPYLAGKIITRKSPPPISASTHATVVGFNFYGNYGDTFMGKGITNINVYEADNWVSSKLNSNGSGLAPVTMSERVANFSWASVQASPSDNDILRRFDYMITQSHMIAVVAASSPDSITASTQLCSSYNAIKVGRADGLNTYGVTPAGVDGPGRIVPDIVTTGHYAAVSFVTPVVSAAAAMLYETARLDDNLVNARNQPQVIKAVLMAGATKTQFPTWSRTPTRPLDTVVGAGQMNIYNSYHILKAGQFAASSDSTAGASGWDYSTVAGGTNKYYYFDVSDIGTSTDSLSAILSWDRIITNANPDGWNPIVTLPNLELKLYSASGYTLGSLIDSSVYSITNPDLTVTTNPNNIQHIFQPALAPGRYALEVSSLSGSASYALAWGSTLIYAPGDFNRDNLINAVDIDLLYRNFGTSALYDLSGDGIVNQGDVDVLVQQVLHTAYGDANLDQHVDFTDFQALLDHWQLSGGWAHGDFSGDGTVDFTDFQSMLDHWNPTGSGLAPPSSSAVPEPASLLALAIGGLALLRRR